LTALTAFAAWRALRGAAALPPLHRDDRSLPAGFPSLVISSFSYLVPPSLTIWQTAAA
jgi:cytochrome d ubiquinol oxidase subunit II